jgi:hypothetical protein
MLTKKYFHHPLATRAIQIAAQKLVHNVCRRKLTQKYMLDFPLI